MAKLYYGGGNCSIEGSNIRGVQIKYTGAISIIDKTSDSFAIAHQRNGIMIFPIGEGFLSDLFDYEGKFKITSIIVADNNGEKISASVNRVMDYAELLNTNAEDMTTNSENLSQTHISGRKVDKTTTDRANINNLHTSKHNVNLLLKDGTLYEGYFHIHLSDNSAMTEKEHTENSKDLYYENGKPTKNPTLIPRAKIIHDRGRKGVKRSVKRTTNRSGY